MMFYYIFVIKINPRIDKNLCYCKHHYIILFIQMKNDRPPKRNARISLQRRARLIQLTNKPGNYISKIARRLNLKLSTARIIVRKYEQTGIIFEKNMSARLNNKKQDPNRSHSENEEQKNELSQTPQNRQNEAINNNPLPPECLSSSNPFYFHTNPLYYYYYVVMPRGCIS